LDLGHYTCNIFYYKLLW